MALRHSILMSMFLLGLLSSEVGVVWAAETDAPESAPAPADLAPSESPPAPPAPAGKRPPPPPADLPPSEAPSPADLSPSEAPSPTHKRAPPPKKASPPPKKSPRAPPPAPNGSQGVNVVDRGAASTVTSRASSGLILATALLALLLR